jgi:hypothetical protein
MLCVGVVPKEFGNEITFATKAEKSGYFWYCIVPV